MSPHDGAAKRFPVWETKCCFPLWEMLEKEMRIIARSTIAQYAENHPNAKVSLDHWVSVTRAAQWRSINDVVGSFSKAKAINRERVRFEVAGGNYRLIVSFHFPLQIAYVKFVGTHEEYDRVDAATVNLF